MKNKTFVNNGLTFNIPENGSVYFINGWPYEWFCRTKKMKDKWEISYGFKPLHFKKGADNDKEKKT